MTPTPPTDNATVKQQREQKRQQKLAEYQKQLAKRKRSKLVWWTAGSATAVVLIGAIVASIVLTPQRPDYTAGGDGAKIEGVQTFTNETKHVDGAVDYPQSPPAGGPHNPVWLNCGIYDQPVPNENAVHALEHGAIWITYDASKVSADDIATLKKDAPSTYAVLSPYEGLDTPIAVSAWNHQLKVDKADDPRIQQFIEEYWRSQTAPEPGAPCTGGVDAPGKE